MEAETFREYLHRKRREESYFFELFFRVLRLMAKVSENPEEMIEDFVERIEIGIETIIARFKAGPEGACNLNNFSSHVNRLSYFYWSSPLAAGVTREKTLVALHNCGEFRSFFCIPSLKMVSIGAGTGSDLVGLFSALHEYFDRVVNPQPIFQEMELLLIDNNIKWEPYFRNIVKSLRHPNADFGNAREWMRNSNITTSFICADLRQLPELQQRELGNTHIVWMKGIMSILESNFDRRNIVNDIVESMSSGALLVFIDSPCYEVYVSGNNSLQKIFTTMERAGRYQLQPFSYAENGFQYAASTNQEISIFLKLSKE